MLFQRLKEIGLSPGDFAEILILLEEYRGKEMDPNKPASGERTLDYLSTQPATKQRIERALASR